MPRFLPALSAALMLLAGAGLAWLVSELAAPAASQEPTPTPATLVRFRPVSQTVAAGASVTADIEVEGIAAPGGLGSYEFIVSFEPTVLSFATATNGPFLGSSGRSVTCLPPRLDVDGDTDVDPGLVRFGCVTIGALPSGPNGGGLLATVTFASSCEGTSPLDFALATLTDPLANHIPATTLAGEAAVTGGPPCPTPTPAGDVDCNSTVNAIDAALMLQLAARLLDSLACEDGGDVNGDDRIDPLDALLVLQLNAGLLDHLPV